MSRPDIDNLIAEVFALTGVKLTADDPIVAVLLLQRQSVQTAMRHLSSASKMRAMSLCSSWPNTSTKSPRPLPN